MKELVSSGQRPRVHTYSHLAAQQTANFIAFLIEDLEQLPPALKGIALVPLCRKILKRPLQLSRNKQQPGEVRGRAADLYKFVEGILELLLAC
jgi:hypothetical protein